MQLFHADNVCHQMNLIIGNSEPVVRLKELIKQVVNTDLNILITGESGVGKELVVRSLHALSDRGDRPLVKVNCAALPGELLESELFGYEKGAFTGATMQKKGKFELAQNSTIFLDEIGDMSFALQAKLLQVLQDSVFSRVGGVEDVEVDAWVIAATHHDLELDVQNGKFREDLYYRLNMIKIMVPPLRDRKEDIPLLCDHFMRIHKGLAKGREITLSRELMDLFQEYNWPGNIRELENFIKRLMVFGESAPLCKELTIKIKNSQNAKSFTEPWVPDKSALDTVMEECRADLKRGFPSLKEISKKATGAIEAMVIEEALKRTDGNRKQAADLLQISYKALLYKIKDYGVMIPGQLPPE